MAAMRMALLYLGIFAPSLVALSLTAWAEGRAGVMTLLRRLVQWRVAGRWFVFAVVYMAAIKLAVALLHRVLTGAWPQFGSEAWYVIVAATVFSTVIGGQAGEEIGWRGYALPRLAGHFGLAGASIVLGVIWALWHLPLFFVPGASTYGQSFPLYTLQVTALSIALAWLYEHANGSLLLTMLMHSAINQSKDIVPSAVATPGSPFTLSSSVVAWLTVIVLWICAGYFLVRMQMSETRRRENASGLAVREAIGA
jgi:membrane protease YdiL (CAAX protease family)